MKVEGSTFIGKGGTSQLFGPWCCIALIAIKKLAKITLLMIGNYNISFHIDWLNGVISFYLEIFETVMVTGGWYEHQWYKLLHWATGNGWD